MSELSPCPFCGSKGILEANFGREWWVQCEEGHSDGIIYDSPQEAETAWNTRYIAATKAQTVDVTEGTKGMFVTDQGYVFPVTVDAVLLRVFRDGEFITIDREEFLTDAEYKARAIGEG